MVQLAGPSPTDVEPDETRPGSDAARWNLPGWLLLPALAFLAASLYGIDGVRQSGYIDFTVYYNAGEALRHGAALYSGPHVLPFLYPPIAAALAVPLTVVPVAQAATAWYWLSVAALGWTAWLLVGRLQLRGLVRLAMAAALVGLLLRLDPIKANLGFGQVNILLMAVIVTDLVRRPDRWNGLGVGLATSIKLTPGLFLLYLLLTRRFRAFFTGSALFAATVVVGFVVAPHDSAGYWGGGVLGDRIAKVTPTSYANNQSLHGLVTRLTHDGAATTPLWLGMAAVVLVVGLAVAVRLNRIGEDLAAVATVGLVALLVSPVSWGHHWVWIAVVLVAVADVTRRHLPALSRWAQVMVVGLPTLLYLLFVDWPALIWRVPFSWMPLADEPEYHWTLQQRLLGETYNLVGLCLLALAAGWLLWSRRHAAAPPQQIPRPGTRQPLPSD
jgi:alpha-1,2-mannosyltransferase